VTHIINPTPLAADVILRETDYLDRPQISLHDPVEMPDMKIEVCPHP
jgi:hypothetical protein